MQAIVIILLLGVLAGAMAFFAVMGMAQVRRTRALARRAHAMGMQFSEDDPFDVPRRYAHMALVGAGHSPRADNVTYGRLDALPVRAFDFRYEAGHGPRRVTRHYSVVAADADTDLPAAIIWHEDDKDFAPLQTNLLAARVDCWSCVGGSDFARELAEACRPLTGQPVSAETRGATMMLCVPVDKGASSAAMSVADAAAALREIRARAVAWAQRHR